MVQETYLAIKTTATIDRLAGLHTQQPKSAKHFLPGIALVAIIFFITINAGFFLWAQLYGLHKYKSCENIMNIFQTAVKHPDIVLVGSSLMRLPFYLTDVTHSNVLDQEDYYWSRTLQNLLNSNTLTPHSIFDFAIDGSMVSDVYLVHKKFFSGTKAPKWIIYGIAPRDFFDNFSK